VDKTKEIRWLKEKSELLIKECSKYISIQNKSLKIKDLRDIIFKKTNTALDLLEKYKNTDENPYILELVYILYYSCINELVGEIIRHENNINEKKLFFNLNKNLFPIISNNLIHYKKVTGLQKNSVNTFIGIEIWRKNIFKYNLNSGLKFNEFVNYFLKASFKVQFFLIENGFIENVLVQFSLLNKKRNHLNIVHGSSNNNYNEVRLRDCRILLFFLTLLIRTDLNNDKKNVINNYFKNIIKIPPIMNNNSLIIKGILREKIYENNLRFFVASFIPNWNIDEMSFKCCVNKEDFNKYKENDILEIEYEMKAEKSSGGKYFNNIYAKKISKCIPLQ
jgi:hypothetical protein